ncbi:MAG TPA: hypothetical protein VLJ11_03170 [Bryobacteraceae bacterium]|nr:hypothetical protein [Bryobacteraceae bacterium]
MQPRRRDQDVGAQAKRMLRRQRAPDFLDRSHEWRRLFAEMWGTFLLVVVAAGAGVVSAQSGGAVRLASTSPMGQDSQSAKTTECGGPPWL